MPSSRCGGRRELGCDRVAQSERQA
jgi:hypothetical protein